jgi:hypothetical protein
MSTNKIKIDHVTGGKNKDDLKNCYFEPSTEDPGGYDFYDKTGHRLARDLNVGEPFEFNMDGLTWVLYDWTCDSLHASGNWRNNGPAVDPALEQEGTFTAQAGGGVDGETDDPGIILPLERISIVEVLQDGVGPVKNALLNCFFSPEGPAGEYMFFKHDGQKLHSQIHGGEKIKVEIDEQIWELTTHFHPHSETAHGHWKLKKLGAGEEDQGGTFTAQAGGGLTAASAYA